MRLAGMMENLLVYPRRMLANLESPGDAAHSGEVLLTLTKRGFRRKTPTVSCKAARWRRGLG
jgi:adenylosuccinate lyase